MIKKKKKLVIEISEEDYEKINKTSFVENTETMFRQSPEDRKSTMMLFRIMDAIKDGSPLEDVFNKIKAEIWEEAEWAYSDFDDYKTAVLEAEPDELPDDDFRFGLHRAIDIINKYRK